MVWVYKIDFLFQPQVEAAAEEEVLNIIAVRWRLLPRLQLHQPQGHHPLGQVCHQLHPDLSTQTVSFLRKTVLSGMKGSLGLHQKQNFSFSVSGQEDPNKVKIQVPGASSTSTPPNKLPATKQWSLSND